MCLNCLIAQCPLRGIENLGKVDGKHLTKSKMLHFRIVNFSIPPSIMPMVLERMIVNRESLSKLDVREQALPMNILFISFKREHHQQQQQSYSLYSSLLSLLAHFLCW